MMTILRSPRAAYMLCAGLTAAALAGCAAGPDFARPTPAAPQDWTTWRSGDDSLRAPVGVEAGIPDIWWQAFDDRILDQLQDRAVASSPDLRTAALHYAQARAQRNVTRAGALPQIDANAQVARQRQSEYGAGTRLFDAVGGNLGNGADRDTLANLLGEPFTLYQSGIEASWEIDLWGRVRRSIEAADADIDQQAALLELARLSLSSDVAEAYLNLRSTQRRVQIARQDLAVLREQAELLRVQMEGGLISHLNLDQQRALLEGVEAELPPLLAREAGYANEIALLIGERPGALTPLLAPRQGEAASALPDLALGLPSDIARRRPDIRAAEARLHSATANRGVAQADLYPRIRLGGQFSFESYRRETLFDWASRSFTVGPTVDLPLFDGGRRRSVVQLRGLEQKEAAVAYQKTVLQAWGEIDNALSGYAAEQQQNARLVARRASARAAYELADARYRGGLTTYLPVLDSHRTLLQASRDLVESDGRLGERFVVINRAIGLSPPAQAGAKRLASR